MYSDVEQFAGELIFCYRQLSKHFQLHDQMSSRIKSFIDSKNLDCEYNDLEAITNEVIATARQLNAHPQQNGQVAYRVKAFMQSSCYEAHDHQSHSHNGGYSPGY